ncbi:MAG: response regulator [Candidatus Nealsonbacteria bacterium]|nr:response regulator [Candidatus Nealsonbacteria bacterium]
MKILIVDNDINTVEVLRASLLSKVNHEIDVAYSGEEALEMMKKNGYYDLLILDIMMPKISGLDVCDLMIKDERLKNIPVLLVSALPIASKSFQESLEKFKELKLVKDVLEKPFEIDNLVNKVKAIVSK